MEATAFVNQSQTAIYSFGVLSYFGENVLGTVHIIREHAKNLLSREFNNSFTRLRGSVKSYIYSQALIP